MKHKNEIGLVLKKRLNEHLGSPDEEVWIQIESILKREKRKKIKRLILITFLIISFCLSLFIVNSRPITRKNNNKHEIIVDKKHEENTDKASSKSTFHSSNLNKNSKVKSTKITKNKTKLNKKKSLKNNKKEKVFKIELDPNGFVLQIKNEIEKLHINVQKTNEKDPIEKLIKTSVSINNGINYFNSYSINNSLNNNLANNPNSKKLSYNFGLYINFQLKDIYSIRIGAQYLSLNRNINNININSNSPQLISFREINNLNSEYINSNLEFLFNNDQNISLNETIKYLEVPVEFGYTFYNSEKSNFKILLGYSQLFLRSAEIWGSSPNTNNFFIGELKSVSKTNISINFGVLNKIKLYDNFYLYLELNYKNYLNTYNTKAINSKPFNINFQTGFIFDLK
ncbi:hypothetical protein [Tenacibaculum geojense]|uniref:Outer membrane protein beta-barrel domain-containing protein n=1 Tax=Tenacibaculum geojense TaxID=915352 RepID=A0ABW3JTD0_9FLAO